MFPPGTPALYYRSAVEKFSHQNENNGGLGRRNAGGLQARCMAG
jgi:hypothetical protein